MFPYRFPTALITTLALAQPQIVIAQDIIQINNIAKNITVKITGYGNGSGVIFEKKGNIYSVVTNQHVVAEDKNYEIRTNDGRKHKVISRKEIPGFDLAILTFESGQSYQVATMGDSDKINALQRIYVAGFPGETIDIDIIEGTIRSIRQEIVRNPGLEKGYALIYTNQTLPGSSGGAVLDEKGRLIAINGQGTRDIQTGRDISRGIPINIFVTAKENLVIAINNLPESQEYKYIFRNTVPNPFFSNSSSEENNNSTQEKQGLALLQDAVELIKSQEYESALPKAESATQLAPNNYEAWFILGSLYAQLGQLDRGIEALEKAEELAPNQEAVLFSLGNAYFQNGNYQIALRKLEAGLKIEENSHEALFELGNAYFKLAQLDKAISSYKKSFAQKEDFWPAINNIGLVEYEKGNIDQAIINWQKAIKIDGELAEPKLALAVALYSQGEIEQGIELAKFALVIDKRYEEIEFLKENLWGDQLIQDFKQLFETL
ncbi:MAG: tetratricopeptide repeat protein [Cyanobacteria bacterium P01_F01_bin.143]